MLDKTKVSVEREAKLYPPSDIEGRDDVDIITPQQAPTLAAIFRERVRRSSDKVAYKEYDAESGQWREYTWGEIAQEVIRWQTTFEKEGLRPGDRVGLRLRNGRYWPVFDQAALGLGLVVVPLYVDDRADNVSYIANHAQLKLLLLQDQEQWQEMLPVREELSTVQCIVVLEDISDPGDERVVAMGEWLLPAQGELRTKDCPAEELATVVYTSGTTGRPKGVMLSHHNLVSNTYASLNSVGVSTSEISLSFLPLSHTLERTVGYYLPMMAGAKVCYARSVRDLAEDLMTIRPHFIVTVPRVFERVYSRVQTQLESVSALRRMLFHSAVAIGWRRFLWRQGRGPWRPSFLLWPLLERLVARKLTSKLGGRLRVVISGGAAFPPAVSRVFTSLGLNILQGYGLTESSPVIAVNTRDFNIPSSIGLPVQGVQVRIGDNDELLAKGPNIMMGYLNNEEATRAAIDDEGWLHSGDKARIENGFIFITGRLKEIIVLANGEKVPPNDMESAIAEDPLFEQSMVIGEAKPYLSALVVLNPVLWQQLAKDLGVNAQDPASLRQEHIEQHLTKRIAERIKEFPGYAQIYRVTATLEPWTVDNGLTTPTMKLRRAHILEYFHEDIARMYEGH